MNLKRPLVEGYSESDDKSKSELLTKNSKS